MCSDVATSGKNTNLGGYLFGFLGLYIIFCLSVLFGVHAQL